MRQSTWKLCFAIFSVLLLTAVIVVAEDFSLNDKGVGGGGAAVAVSPPVLSQTPEVAPQVPAVSAPIPEVIPQASAAAASMPESVPQASAVSIPDIPAAPVIEPEVASQVSGAAVSSSEVVPQAPVVSAPIPDVIPQASAAAGPVLESVPQASAVSIPDIPAASAIEPGVASQVSDAAVSSSEVVPQASVVSAPIPVVIPQASDAAAPILESVPQASVVSAPIPEVIPQASAAAAPMPEPVPQASAVSVPEIKDPAAPVMEPGVASKASGDTASSPGAVSKASDAAASSPGVAPKASVAPTPIPVVVPQASFTAASMPKSVAQASAASMQDIPDLEGFDPESPDNDPGAAAQNLAVSVPISEGDIPDMGASAQVQPAGEGGGFFVKFNNANLYEVIHTLAANAGINYTIDPRVKGVVNVHTQGMLKKSSALDLLFTILRVNGATAVKEGDTYHILPMSDARMEPLVPSLAGDTRVKGAPGQVSMRAYPLQHISVGEMATVIKPFLSPAGEAVEVGRANTLLVIDTEANLDKIVRLVELLDSDVFKSAGVRLFQLKTLDPDEMVKNLENIFGALNFASNGTKPSGINFVPINRLNSVLVVSASPQGMADVERWILELDRPGGSSSRSVHSYRLRYGKVADIAAILMRLYPSSTASVEGGGRTEFKPSVSLQSSGSSSSTSGGMGGGGMGGSMGGGGMGGSMGGGGMGGSMGGGMSQSASQGAVRSPSRSGAAQSRGGGRAGASSSTDDEKSFYIIPDEATNSLIIRASLAEYADLLAILKTIDVYPQQVLLEVLVGEVNLSDDMKLGISWQWSGTSGTNQGVNHSVKLMDPGFLNNFSYFVEKTNRLTAMFKSLAENGRASILSSPSVIASNGKESTIFVVDQIPITTSVLNSATNPPVTTTSVTYRDVGVILKFTPYINDDGLVTMEIEQEVSDINLGSASVGSNPSFFKRSIATNLIASQDQSIVLGGLVKEKKSLDRSGLPFFYKIPVIGWLFGAREDGLSRNELLIFITPRVIRNVEEGVKLSRDFEDRVAQLKARMVEAKGIRGQ